jgi:DNA-binding transcriptional MerR regulator
MAYTVKQVAEISGVSVRTLHFYDEVGLLKPAYIGANGYRYYEERQVLTLQQILFFRTLGLELKQIHRILTRPDFDQIAALESHRKVLRKSLADTRKLIQTIELLVCRRSFSTYGLSLGGWRESLKIGLFCGLLVVGGAGLLYVCGIQHRAGSSPPELWEGCAYALSCFAGVFLLVRLSGPMCRLAARLPDGSGLVLLVAILSVPLMITMWQGHPVLPVALTAMWLVVGAGIGEEVFFRGYIQSRVNEAFGRPLRLRKIQARAGSGRFVPPVRLHPRAQYRRLFQGRFTYAWGFGIATFGQGCSWVCCAKVPAASGREPSPTPYSM